MVVNQTANGLEQTDQTFHEVMPLAANRRQSLSHRWTVAFVILFTVTTAFATRSSSMTPEATQQWGMATIVHHWNFNLLQWEVEALWEKFRAFALRPAQGLDYETSVAFVQDYLTQAETMRALENAIAAQLAGSESTVVADAPGETAAAPSIETLQQQLATLRANQEQQRRTVEQIIEAQIAHELVDADLTLWGAAFPPVQFMFVEPPRKLVVSPRDQIRIDYSQMLDAEMSLAQIQSAEAAYLDHFDHSAYITNIGGLGAFPTMVIDRASLSWILSTVAHEWTHNYLTLFPLGFNYLTSHELTTMNETVAEIVGNEIGQRALQVFYPALVPPPVVTAAPDADSVDESADNTPTSEIEVAVVEEDVFDFRAEMRETRLRVDELLAAGEVEAAEQYMEMRRLHFVANGYPLRVLNQAYFAFHGSYGTSAASTSPIGPKMEALRALSPDLQQFLQTVRTFTSIADLDAALLAASEQAEKN